jgi:hypothetical protein
MNALADTFDPNMCWQSSLRMKWHQATLPLPVVRGGAILYEGSITTSGDKE